MRKGRYWESEKRRRCRLCGGEVETWEHVWERCKGDWGRGTWQEVVGRIWGEMGEGESWIRALEKERQE